MRYLLVNHVAFGRTASPERLQVGDLWLEDLRAQARAIGRFGTLIVAAPLVDHLDPETSASFNVVEFEPRELGVEFVPLPHSISMREYLSVRGDLRRRLKQAIGAATVVQADSGGYPFALGSIVWPLARSARKKRIWVFDGADPFPRLELAVREERSLLKRIGKRSLVASFHRFCANAISEADLVFTHNASVVERFKPWWNARCHSFTRSFVTDGNLLTAAEFDATTARLRERSGPLKLVVAGRQIMIKGTDQVIRALAIARERGVQCTLDVIGDGEDLPKFRELAHALGVDGSVRFVGKVAYGKALFEAWGRAHVLVVTNLTAETSRNVLLGAARGLPLIMYRNPGVDPLVGPRGAAWLVPTADVVALSEAFVRFARERDELVTLARMGWQLAAENTLDACHRRRAELAAELPSN
jgi:glycosyltransferase involved in cell wall biosynthesis